MSIFILFVYGIVAVAWITSIAVLIVWNERAKQVAPAETAEAEALVPQPQETPVESKDSTAVAADAPAV